MRLFAVSQFGLAGLCGLCVLVAFHIASLAKPPEPDIGRVVRGLWLYAGLAFATVAAEIASVVWISAAPHSRDWAAASVVMGGVFAFYSILFGLQSLQSIWRTRLSVPRWRTFLLASAPKRRFPGPPLASIFILQGVFWTAMTLWALTIG